MSGEDAGKATVAAEAESRERVKLAERWINIPRQVPLTLHAVNEMGCWYARPLGNGMQSHGLAPWKDVLRELAAQADRLARDAHEDQYDRDRDVNPDPRA